MRYLLATRKSMRYHHDYLLKYFSKIYTVVDNSHDLGKESKKSESVSSFLFDNVTEELKTELLKFGFEISGREKRVKLS